MPAFSYPTAFARSTAAFPMRSRSSWSRATDGDSSSSFWCRRWIEHSRSPRWTTVPWRSPKIWNSTWRGPTRYFSR